MKISRVYLKIYFYFLGILSIVVLVLIPVTFVYSVDKPFKNLFEKRLSIISSVVRYSLFSKDLSSAVKNIAKETSSDVTVYNERGEVLISSSTEAFPLNHDIMEKAMSRGFNLDILRHEKRFLFLIYVNNPSCAYMSFLGDLGDPKDRASRFFFWLIVICLLVSLLIYPLSIQITKPLEKITEKAIKFSKGDFSFLDKVEKRRAVGDEIDKLDTAFTNMAEELLRMIEAKKELLSDISHEMGSPLSRMKVSVELIEDKIEIGKTPSLELIKGLSDDIDEMAGLVKELLDFSKMDLKGYNLNFRNTDIAELAEGVLKSFHHLSEKNNIKLTFIREGNFSPVSIDPDKVSRVIQNLLMNAIKYSPLGSTIELKVKGEGDQFYLSVTDEGKGIEKGNEEKIFEPFFREDPSRTRGTGGTGLGLAIARKIVELHKGKIMVENPGEKGAIISFRI